MVFSRWISVAYSPRISPGVRFCGDIDVCIHIYEAHVGRELRSSDPAGLGSTGSQFVYLPIYRYK